MNRDALDPDAATGRAVSRALHRTEAQLAETQPLVGDWGAAVHRGLRRRRARAGGIAAVLAFGAISVVVAAMSSNGKTDSLVAGPPATGPTPVSSSELPTAEPTPSPRATPTPAAVEPRSAPPAAPSPAEVYPPYGAQDITVTANVSDPTPRVGEEVVVEVVATGHAEEPPFLQGPRIDGSGPGWIAGSCPGPAENTSPPPARDQRATKSVRHTFDAPGRHTMTFRADSACSYYRGSDEITVVIDVQPAPSASTTSATV